MQQEGEKDVKIGEAKIYTPTLPSKRLNQQ